MRFGDPFFLFQSPLEFYVSHFLRQIRLSWNQLFRLHPRTIAIVLRIINFSTDIINSYSIIWSCNQ